jgi:hypothetical protein
MQKKHHISNLQKNKQLFIGAKKATKQGIRQKKLPVKAVTRKHRPLASCSKRVLFFRE